MKIVVDRMPENSGKCLFKKHYNEQSNTHTCMFSPTRVCFLDYFVECEYLCAHRELERDEKNET